jgi:hypothetical protein
MLTVVWLFHLVVVLVQLVRVQVLVPQLVV